MAVAGGGKGAVAGMAAFLRTGGWMKEEIEDLLGKKRKKIPIKELASFCGLRTADCRLRTADCGLQTVDCGLMGLDGGYIWQEVIQKLQV